MGPEDIELGTEPIQVERPRRAGVVISVRLAPEEADRLEDVAEKRGTTLSNIAREAITGYLNYGAYAPPAAVAWTFASVNSSFMCKSYGPAARTRGEGLSRTLSVGNART